MDIKEIEEWWARRPAELLKRPINGYWEEVTDWLIQRVRETEDAIDNAQREHPDEVHCSCVPLLKMRIKELEDGIKKHRDVFSSKVPWDEELYKLVEE